MALGLISLALSLLIPSNMLSSKPTADVWLWRFHCFSCFFLSTNVADLANDTKLIFLSNEIGSIFNQGNAFS